MEISAHQEDHWQRAETRCQQRPVGPRAMSASRFILWLGLALALQPTGSSASAANPSSYDRGLEAAENYRYSEALMYFQKGAEQGDRNAQRNLGLMLLYGELLYGKEASRNQVHAKRWLQAAAAEGCEISTFMLKVLAQHGR